MQYSMAPDTGKLRVLWEPRGGTCRPISGARNSLLQEVAGELKYEGIWTSLEGDKGERCSRQGTW